MVVVDQVQLEGPVVMQAVLHMVAELVELILVLIIPRSQEMHLAAVAVQLLVMTDLKTLDSAVLVALAVLGFLAQRILQLI
jgi:hypothetical protein